MYRGKLWTMRQFAGFGSPSETNERFKFLLKNGQTGLSVAFGHDCVLDPWYPLGSQDMLEVAHMALHVAHMTGADDMKECFKAVTTNPAKVMHLDNYGLEKGCNGEESKKRRC